MSRDPLLNTRGPFRAHQLRSGDPYELSNGHTIRCLPTGARGALATGAGYKALVSDPEVEDLAIDAGFSPVSETMRAPDLAVGKIADAPGWVDGIPELAVEYADTGQDEVDLAQKIEDLLAAGTRFIWVVRLHGPRRVEVYEPNQPMRQVMVGEELHAPGVLANAVPVAALYDREIAEGIDFRNVLHKKSGHETLDALRREEREEGKVEGKVEGKAEGKAEAILTILEARKIVVSEATRSKILGCKDLPTLERWLQEAMEAPKTVEITLD